jgi:hypothetical protein
LCWGDGAAIALALKEDTKAYERIDLHDPFAIETTVARTTGDGFSDIPRRSDILP